MTALIGPICVLLLAAARQDAVEPKNVARVNDEALSLEAFRDWIVRTHGWRHLDDYVDLALLKQESARAGLAPPTPAEIEAAFDADWRDQILWRHGGSETAFEQELSAAGVDRQGWRDRRRGTLEQETIAKRILRARPPTDDDMKKLWQREFGPDGVRTHLRVAFFDKYKDLKHKDLKPGEQATGELADRGEERSRLAAAAFHKLVAADRSQFAARVASDSDLLTVPRFDSIPVDLRANRGDLPRLHADHWNGVLKAPLADAKSGDLLPPIATPQGWYVVEVIERSPAPFDAVQEELREIWRTREPSQGEIHWLKDELRRAARITRFPLDPPTQQH